MDSWWIQAMLLYLHRKLSKIDYWRSSMTALVEAIGVGIRLLNWFSTISPGLELQMTYMLMLQPIQFIITDLMASWNPSLSQLTLGTHHSRRLALIGSWACHHQSKMAKSTTAYLQLCAKS